MKTVQIPTTYGHQQVRALSLNLFLIHRAILGDDIVSSKTWTATHKASGLAIGHFKSKPQAREAAKAFSALFEMYGVEDDLVKWVSNTTFCQLATEVLESLDVIEATGEKREL